MRKRVIRNQKVWPCSVDANAGLYGPFWYMGWFFKTFSVLHVRVAICSHIIHVRPEHAFVPHIVIENAKIHVKPQMDVRKNPVYWQFPQNPTANRMCFWVGSRVKHWQNERQLQRNAPKCNLLPLRKRFRMSLQNARASTGILVNYIWMPWFRWVYRAGVFCLAAARLNGELQVRLVTKPERLITIFSCKIILTVLLIILNYILVLCLCCWAKLEKLARISSKLHFRGSYYCDVHSALMYRAVFNLLHCFLAFPINHTFVHATSLSTNRLGWVAVEKEEVISLWLLKCHSFSEK